MTCLFYILVMSIQDISTHNNLKVVSYICFFLDAIIMQQKT